MSVPTMMVRYMLAIGLMTLAFREAMYMNVVVDSSVRASSTGTSFVVLMLGLLIWDRSELFRDKLISLNKKHAQLSIFVFALSGVGLTLSQCELCSFERGNHAYGRVLIGSGLFTLALMSLFDETVVGCLNRWKTNHILRRRKK